MKTKVFVYLGCILLSCWATTLPAQQSPFSKVFYDPAGSVQGYSIAKTFDQNFMVAGQKDNRAMVMKVSPAGIVMWGKKISSFNGSYFNCVITTHDSTCLLAGVTPDTATGIRDIACTRITASGDTLWSKKIAFGTDAYLYSVSQTSDHGFILGGYLVQPVSPGKSMLVIKLDASGGLTWARILAASNSSGWAASVKQTTDGGYAVTGSLENTSHMGAACLVKLTPGGDFSWATQQWLGASTSESWDVIVKSDGYMVLSSSPDPGMVLMKISLAGNFIWGQEYNVGGGTGTTFFKPKLHATSDGGYAFVSCGYGMDQFLVTAPLGTLKWGQEMLLISSDVSENTPGKYMILGNGPIIGTKTSSNNPQVGLIYSDSSNVTSNCINPNSFSSGPCSVILNPVTLTASQGGSSASLHPAVIPVILTSFEGCISFVGSTEDKNPGAAAFSVVPNPSDGLFRIMHSQPAPTETVHVDVFNNQGVTVFQTSCLISDELRVDIRTRPAGIYYVRLTTGDKIFTQKILLAR